MLVHDYSKIIRRMVIEVTLVGMKCIDYLEQVGFNVKHLYSERRACSETGIKFEPLSF